MIKLTYNNCPVYVAAEQITGTYKDGEITRIDAGGRVYGVDESLEEVAKKVLEWKLAMEDYGHDDAAPVASRTMFRLAGLDKGKSE